MRNEEIARGIRERTPEKTTGLILTDSLPFQDRGMSRDGRAYRIADVFAEEGCPLQPANTARVTGWAQVRDRLIGIDGDPLLLITENCRYLRDYLPALPRSTTNPEDAAESGEATHLCDCVRYACTARPLVRDAKREKATTLSAPPNQVIITPRNLLKQLRARDYGRRNTTRI